jgi:hypothetical protein
MSFLGVAQTTVLETIAVRPRHHFELRASERLVLVSLWGRGLISLSAGDIWLLSARGRTMLNCRRALH